MAETTDRLTPMKLAAIGRRCDRFEKALHDGTEYEFTAAAAASAVDVRPLLEDVEALRDHVAELRTANLHRLVALVPSGELRNRLAALVAETERELSKASDEEVSSGR